MGKADEIFQIMTLRQKVGYMICVRGYDYKDEIISMLSEGCIGTVGSIIITQKGSRKLDEVVSAMNRYYEVAQMPFGFFMDAECGITDMFDFGTSFPTFMALGATFSTELAYKMGNIIAKEGRALGFTILCCPVLDVNTNRDNPIICTRAISDRVEPVVRLGGEYIRGMQDAGMIPTGKHFPGHGDTGVDSHISMPVVEHDIDRLMNIELKPYKELIQDGLLGIMTAHIVYPKLLDKDEEGLPATLSRNIITNILRKELGFNGLILSDSLAMKGIKDVYGLEKCAVMAVKAGHDIILQDYNTNPELTLDAVVAAVESGEIEMVQIDESVKRILTTLERMGTLDSKPLDVEQVRKITGAAEHRAVAQEIADRSVTLLEGCNIPLDIKQGESVLVIATRSEEEGKIAEDFHANIVSKSEYLYNKCKEYTENVVLYLVSDNPDESEVNKVLQISGKYDHIIYATFIRVISYKEWSGSIPPSQAGLINTLNKLGDKAAFIILGSPYVLNKLDRLHNCMVTYGDCEYSIDAALKVLFGKMKPQGRLPVSINKRYTFGGGF